MRRIADISTLHPRRTLLMTGLAMLVALAVGGPLAGLLEDGSGSFDDPAAESAVAVDRISKAAGVEPDPSVLALVETPTGARSPQGRARIVAVERALGRDPAVARTASWARTPDAAFLSRDGRSTYVAAFMRDATGDKGEAAARMADSLAATPGVTVGGQALAQQQVGEQVSEDLAKAELLAFPLLFLVSLFFFRGVVAALLPLVVGALSIMLTFLVLRGVNAIDPLSIFALNLTTGLGLGLAIDYSLFMVSRYREELARVGPGREAVRRTVATAGRTVLFSALTVSAALASLLVFPLRFLSSMGTAGAIVALIAAAVSVIVLPAILALLGERVNALAPRRWQVAGQRRARGESSGGWYRFSRWVMRRPGRVALGATVLLLALALPFLGIRFTGVDAGVLPEQRSARQVHDALTTSFAAGRTAQLIVAAEGGEAARGQAVGLAGQIRALPGVATVSVPRAVGGTLWQIDVAPRGTELDSGTKQLVRDIRALPSELSYQTAGPTAELLDRERTVKDSLPVALAIIAVTTFLILFAMTGSVVLPVKALLMNLLTIAAAFGVLVLVFQDGRLEGLLDYTSQGALELTQPMLLFAIAFGLSTDYGVFLLTRIKEARDAGAGDTEAVAIGLERTGRIVTAAAVLFSIAIGAFATSQIIFIKEVGVGTAVAVLIDATIVRALLVPSLMGLLGKWNWWAPRPLRRLHARLRLGGGGSLPGPAEGGASPEPAQA